MTPERWELVNEIFRRALERDRSERPALIAAACGADDELRLEVEKMLEWHDKSGQFLSDPAVEAVTRLLGAERPRIAPGDRIGPYEIV